VVDVPDGETTEARHQRLELPRKEDVVAVEQADDLAGASIEGLIGRDDDPAVRSIQHLYPRIEIVPT
jgi:hypothetical protein